MSVVVLVVSIVVLIIAVVLFLQKPKGGNSISEEELKRLREENSGLQIAFAKAEERAAGLILERDKADKLLQEERVRHDQAVATLNSELLALAADKSIPVNMDYKINNIAVTANGKQIPIPPKATEKDIKLVGHISQDWRITLDSANGKAVADTARQKVQQMMNMLQKQIQFPDKPLKPGDSFTQRAPMNIPVGKDSTSAKIDASVTYKLIKIADGKAYFDMIPNFSLNVLAGKASVNMSGTGTGTMVYSIKDDFPLSKEGNINLNIKVVTPKVNIDGTAVVTSKYDCVISTQ
jgi:hypothetical protein